MTPTHYFKAWLFFFLVATVGGMFVGMLLGALLGAVLAIARVDLQIIKIVCGAVGFLISVPLSYFTFYWVVSQFIVKPLQMPPALTQAIPGASPAPTAAPPAPGGSA